MIQIEKKSSFINLKLSGLDIDKRIDMERMSQKSPYLEF
jgi:hypothetical protein